MVLFGQQQGSKLDQLSLRPKVVCGLGISNACLAIVEEEYGPARLIEGVIDPKAVQKGAAAQSQVYYSYCNCIIAFFKIKFSNYTHVSDGLKWSIGSSMVCVGGPSPKATEKRLAIRSESINKVIAEEVKNSVPSGIISYGRGPLNVLYHIFNLLLHALTPTNREYREH